VRTAMLVEKLDSNHHALLFGDQSAWFYAVEAETGRLLWKKQIDPHEAARVTGAPAAYQGVVFVPAASWEETNSLKSDYQCCTFRGSVTALRIRDGEQVWKAYTIPGEPKQTGKSATGQPQWGPSGAGTWSAPTVDAKRGALYVTTGNNYSMPSTETSDAVLALDLTTGRILWGRQVTPRDMFAGGCGKTADCGGGKGPDFDFGSSAMLVKVTPDRELLLAGQKSGVVYALDPDRKGAIVWQTRIAKGSAHGGVQWGMASDGQHVYAAIADGDMVKVKGEDGVVRQVMDPKGGGGMVALRTRDGSKAWSAPPLQDCDGAKLGCSPAQLAAVTAIPGVVFSGAMDGHIRAYSSEDGKILWDFDTAREFSTVNGVPANGGAINGPGAVVANGMVFVNSGYDHFGSLTGNVLLAFGPEGQ
jgi:polyvinyl alcohol dehydrogenase (cytochrome)